MSKPIHPFSFSEYTVEDEESYGSVTPSNYRMRTEKRIPDVFAGVQYPGSLYVGGNSQRDANSSVGFTVVSGSLEADRLGPPRKNLQGGGGSRCGLCERLLAQKSPWGALRMVLSGDMPTTGVLSCCHVFHAECLERFTPKPQRHDPPCPICEKLENGHGVEQWAISRLKNGLPRLRSLGEEGPSRVWSCGQAGDCVQGVIDVPKHSSGTSVLRNRSRITKQLSLKGNSGKERAESSRRSGLCSPRVSLGAVGCSSIVQGPALKRW